MLGWAFTLLLPACIDLSPPDPCSRLWEPLAFWSTLGWAFTFLIRAGIDHPAGLPSHGHVLFQSVLLRTLISHLCACMHLILLVYHLVTSEFPLSTFL